MYALSFECFPRLPKLKIKSIFIIAEINYNDIIVTCFRRFYLSHNNKRRFNVKPIIFEAYPEIAEQLEAYMQREIRDLLKLPEGPIKSTAKRIIDYETWRQTEEGKLHLALMVKYVLQNEGISASAASEIQRRLQSQGRETRGRTKLYDSQLRSQTATRQLRLFALNRIIAKSLGIDCSQWVSPVEVTDVAGWTVPDDAYDSLCRFEEWSGLTLPKQAWLTYTKTERSEASVKHPHLDKAEDGGITLELYKLYRLTPEIAHLTKAA